jgi:hypothetical protein
MCDYWAGRYEHRSAAERSCLEGPPATEGIRLLRELPRTGGDVRLLHTDLDLSRILRWLFARAVEASPYWPGMADLARTLYPSPP